jgi:voltage-gated potassium channel Kch
MNEINSRILMYTPSQARCRCIAFSLDPNLVVNGYRKGFDILYGDGSQPTVLASAGIDATKAKAFVVTHTDTDLCLKTVKKLRLAYPDIPLICRSRQFSYIEKLYGAGATVVIADEKETTNALSEAALKFLGLNSMETDQIFIKKIESSSFASRQYFNPADDLEKGNSTALRVYQEEPIVKSEEDTSTETAVQEIDADGSTICSLPNR